jgi:hypothetical protein
MPPDALPQLIDTLLRLPLLEPAQIRELIHNLPDPQASAQEMLRRGWITQDQFSSLFPGVGEPPRGRETLLVGCGDEDVPTDVDCDNWDLPMSDEDETPALAAEVDLGSPPQTQPLPELASVGQVPVLARTASTPFEWDMLAPAGGNDLRSESSTDRRLRQWLGWSGKGLLMWAVFLGTFFVGRQFFGARACAPPAAHHKSAEATKVRAASDRRRPAATRVAAAPGAAAPQAAATAEQRVDDKVDQAMGFDPPRIIQGISPPAPGMVPPPMPRSLPSGQAPAQVPAAVVPTMPRIINLPVPPPMPCSLPSGQAPAQVPAAVVPAMPRIINLPVPMPSQIPNRATALREPVAQSWGRTNRLQQRALGAPRSLKQRRAGRDLRPGYMPSQIMGARCRNYLEKPPPVLAHPPLCPRRP